MLISFNLELLFRYYITWASTFFSLVTNTFINNYNFNDFFIVTVNILNYITKDLYILLTSKVKQKWVIGIIIF